MIKDIELLNARVETMESTIYKLIKVADGLNNVLSILTKDQILYYVTVFEGLESAKHYEKLIDELQNSVGGIYFE